jgi:hypothetical protein
MALIYKDVGDLSPGVPGQVTLKMRYDSAGALLDVFYRTQWTRVWGVPVLPPATRFHHDLFLPFWYALVSDDTHRQERLMMIICGAR